MDVFDEIVEAAGSQQAIAELCEVSPQAVNKWRKSRIPAQFCKRIEGKWGVPATRQRPDIFGETVAA